MSRPEDVVGVRPPALRRCRGEVTHLVPGGRPAVQEGERRVGFPDFRAAERWRQGRGGIRREAVRGVRVS